MIPIGIYKYLAILVIAIGIFGFGYHAGYKPQHEKLLQFQAQVAQAAADQNAQSKQKDAENEQQTQIIAQTWLADHNRLLAQLDLMRKSGNGSGKLPQAADRNKGNDAAASEPSGIGQCTPQFYSNALEDALKLEEWQQWAIAHQLRVE